MAGYDDRQPPDVEIYIEDGDGPGAPGTGRAPGGRRGAGRRLGVVLAVAAVFALGVVVGRSSVTVPGASTAVTTLRPTGARATPSATGSTRVSAPATSNPAGTMIPRESAMESAVPGACGHRVQAPRIEGTLPLGDAVAMHVIAGGDPAPANVGDDTVGGALFTPGIDEVVTSIAAVRDAAVLLVAPCSGGGPGRVVRVSPGRDATAILLPDDTRRVMLIAGGARVWISASPGSYGFGAVTLLAADGSGDTVTLPGGLEPLGGVGRQVVGQYSIGGVPGGLFGVLDTDSGGMVRQFGASEGTAMNAVVDGQYVIAAPWVCGAACDVLRYRVDTGELHRTRLHPASDRILSGGGAVSPDGRRAAIPLYAQPPSPEPFEPYRLGIDSPNQVTRVGLLNLDTGHVRALPGLTLDGTVSPALAFSADGRWIVVAVGAGYRTRLLLYTSDGAGPYDPHVDIPGLVSSPSLVVTEHALP
jgi:hypothetical protein